MVWGGWQSLNTPIDVFPDLTAPAVTIVAEAHGMPARGRRTSRHLPD